MLKNEILSVTEKKYFVVELKIQGMEIVNLALCIGEDGNVEPLDKSDMALWWQLKLTDENLWKNIIKNIKEKN